jgi:hypothetical protein
VAIIGAYRNGVGLDDFAGQNGLLRDLDCTFGSGWIGKNLRSIDVAVPTMRSRKEYDAAIEKPVCGDDLYGFRWAGQAVNTPVWISGDATPIQSTHRSIRI